jgi:phenylpyruvate tautomerase PptA (4-oxalocrotonate tautomerase family)
MPLWTIYHTPDTYTAEDKHAFAQDITGYYTAIGLPAFYVVVAFQELTPGSFLIGGAPAERSVRIAIQHIAVHADGPETRTRIARSISRLIAPHTSDRQLYAEFHVDETPREMWMVDSLTPPTFGSDLEKVWARENRPIRS